MKVVVANLSGVKVEENGTVKHFAKAGSRWPMTVGYAKSIDYYPFPFWLAYTTALLKRDTEAEVRGLDGVVSDMTQEEFFKEIQDQNPELLITELTFFTLKDDLSLLKRIKKEIGSQIAVCGNYPTVYPKEILEENDFIDYLLFGEYEIAAKELIQNLIEKRSLKEIKGLAYREGKGIVINEKRPLISDLDVLPYPDREDFPATLYPDFTLYSPCISLMASRGCPAGCIFCTERHIMYNSPKYRMRSPKKVVDEMEFCIKKFKARQLYFDDMSFTVNKKYVQKICNEILKRKIKILWTCMGDALFIDYPTLEKMRKAGCIGMKFGIESANPEILKKIGKPLDLKKAKEVVKWCRKLRIRTHATYCLGLPGENKETLKNTLNFMNALRASTSQVSKVVPYPGTPMYKWATEHGYLVTTDLSKYDGAGSSVINYPELSNLELDDLYEKFSKRVARKKVLKYFKEPRQSLSIILEIWRRKGFMSIARSFWTFFQRAF